MIHNSSIEGVFPTGLPISLSVRKLVLHANLHVLRMIEKQLPVLARTLYGRPRHRIVLGEVESNDITRLHVYPELWFDGDVVVSHPLSHKDGLSHQCVSHLSSRTPNLQLCHLKTTHGFKYSLVSVDGTILFDFLPLTAWAERMICDSCASLVWI